jgi:hypothetical protein
MFELPDPMAADSAEGGNGAHEPIAEPSLAGIISRMTAGGLHKVTLPRRPGESRFGPRQYYYPASPSGVVPSCSNQKMPGQQVPVAEPHLDPDGGRSGFG